MIELSPQKDGTLIDASERFQGARAAHPAGQLRAFGHAATVTQFAPKPEVRPDVLRGYEVSGDDVLRAIIMKELPNMDSKALERIAKIVQERDDA